MFHCFRVNTHSCSVLCRFDLIEISFFFAAAAFKAGGKCACFSLHEQY